MQKIKTIEKRFIEVDEEMDCWVTSDGERFFEEKPAIKHEKWLEAQKKFHTFPTLYLPLGSEFHVLVRIENRAEFDAMLLFYNYNDEFDVPKNPKFPAVFWVSDEKVNIADNCVTMYREILPVDKSYIKELAQLAGVL